MKVSVKVPATTANMGPGFDCVGMALPIYNTITIEETVLPGTGIEINVLADSDSIDQLSLDHIPSDENSIVYKAVELLYNSIGQTPSELKINIHSNIPVARGLGSSSSVIVGALIAANELLGRPADEVALLSIACEIEGHPDNITPALYGGFNIAMLVPMKDAIFNAKRLAMFVEAVHTHDSELMKLALQDRLHQPYRMKLVPGLDKIIDNLRHFDNVLGCVLSGAGSSILIISEKNNLDKIRSIVKDTWADQNIKCEIKTLSVENTGAQIISNED